ncbi:MULTISPECIES: LysR family transcriptional regulator [Erythrobacteraceae]|uniref:LysR family transcriptional regulator n=1 Tax=Erythrobacteraceae TaxID=335929 RepID=UPI001C9DBE19|nr:LysR family transcriptional regulator [Aurantiacibacter sp. 219JJ12-13]MBY8334375.1 LysR family transcriptional regulator [Qipengyuania pacifica]MCH2496290.1 LysR family transcriptional regulator [Erythrobacter sp.]MDP5262748.1 LysR family transcriptional regulator [Aurantiacibacter sp. 219JJ12-13]
MLDSRLKYAVAVARIGSFTGAANAVGVTQSAVTKSVADLEQQLGIALFNRTSRGILVTPEGRDFIDRAARLLADADDLFRERNRGADPYAGLLRIGLFPGSMDWLINDAAIGLLKRHEGVRLEIVSGNSERAVQLLSRGDIDVAFGLEAALAGWPQFKCERIAAVDIMPFVRKDHPILSETAIDKQMLARCDFVVPSSSEPYTPIIRQIYEVNDQRPEDRIHMTDYFPLVRRIVAATDSVGLVASAFTSAGWFRDEFVTLPHTGLLEPLVLAYAARARWPVKPAARDLIARVRQNWSSESNAQKQ